MKRFLSCLAVGLVVAAMVSADPAKPGGSPAAKLSHMVALPDDLTWGPGPPGLPPGAKLAILDGNPGTEGPFVVRAKLPDGYVIPPHGHPTDEHITVISGSFGIGLGDSLEKSKIRYLPPGSYARMGKKEKHYAITKGETVIQVHAMGPFEISYVNPADDPTKKTDK
jgi:quercetin dioxygenase-like cupin family protein